MDHCALVIRISAYHAEDELRARSLFAGTPQLGLPGVKTNHRDLSDDAANAATDHIVCSVSGARLQAL
jgi:hypothetical protein